MKHITYIFIVSLLFIACNKTEDSTEKNITLAKAMFQAFNNHDWKKMAETYADTAEFLDPAYGAAYVKKTHAETIEKYSGMQQMFPDIKDDITDISASGDKVIVQFTSSGTPAGGTTWQLPICSVLTFKDGKIIKDATYYDNE